MEGSKEERIRAITNISVKRAVYETTMREFYRRIETERKDRIERTGDPSYTEFEALLPWLVSFLLPEKKCRAVMEYDPAADRIKFFQEDYPAGQYCGSFGGVSRNLQNIHSLTGRTQ